MAYVPAITAAHILVYNHALLNSRHSIFKNCRKHFLSRENDTRFYPTIAHVDCTFALLFAISLEFEEQSKSPISICNGGVKPCVIFSTKKMLPAILKDAVPAIQQSMVVYQYVCRCDC